MEIIASGAWRVGISFRYSSFPQEIIFGAGALEGLGEIAARRGWSRALLVTTQSQRANGTVARIGTSLGERPVAIFDTAQPHVPQANVDKALGLAREKDVDVIVALGGGSAIGVAKATSHALDGRVPIVAVPTTYAGSEMTPLFGVTRERDGVAIKETTNDARIIPRVVIYDPMLTLDLPRDLTASTGMNALAHCVEAVYSITRNPLSSVAGLESARLIYHALPRCVEDGKDVEARTEMLEGAYLAGAALANVAMGLHHGMCHVLGGTANVPHGIANAIVLAHAMRFNADACAHELARIAEAMDVPKQDLHAMALDGARGVEELVARMGLPTRLRDAGVRREDLAKLAALAFQNKTVQNNPKRIGSVERMKEFLEDMF